MSFETDKQTLDDLNLLGKYKNNSVYSLYVGTVTRGGERKMEDMFLHPLTDAKSINERSAVFRYFRDHDFGFPFGKDKLCEQKRCFISAMILNSGLSGIVS